MQEAKDIMPKIAWSNSVVKNLCCCSYIAWEEKKTVSTDEPLLGLVVRVFTAVGKGSCSTDSVVSAQLG